MNRSEVAAVLDGELNYQAAMTASPDRPDMVAEMSLGDIILAMEKCLADARTAWYSGHDKHQPAMDQVRKVGALTIKAGMRFGMPRREGF